MPQSSHARPQFLGSERIAPDDGVLMRDRPVRGLEITAENALFAERAGVLPSAVDDETGRDAPALLTTAPVDRRAAALLERFSRIACMAVAGVSLAVLLGWLLDVPILTSAYPGWATMKANTALCLLLLAGSLYAVRTQPVQAWRQRLALCAAALAAAIALLSFAAHVFSWDPGIDQLLLIDRHSPAGSPPGRMAPMTAVGVALLAVALSLLDRPRLRFVSLLAALLAAIDAGVALVGYLYGIHDLYSVPIYATVALHTALCQFALATAIICARPSSPPAAIAVSATAGGALIRRMLLAALAAPIAIGWLRLRGEQAGYYGTEFGLTLFAIANVAVFTLLIWRTAWSLFRTDVARQHAHRAFVDRAERLEIVHAVDKAILASVSPVETARVAVAQLGRLRSIVNAAVVSCTDTMTDAVILAATAPDLLAPGLPLQLAPPRQSWVDWTKRSWIEQETETLGLPLDAMLALRATGARSCFWLPLLAHGSLRGALVLWKRSTTDTELGAAEEVADQLAIALEQSHLQGQLEAVARVNASLVGVGFGLIASLGGSGPLDRLCRIAADALTCDASCTLLWNDQEAAFIPVGAYGIDDRARQAAAVLRLPRSMLEGTLAKFQHVDVTEDEIPGVLAGHPHVQLCMALRRGRDLVGLLVACRLTEAKAFCEEDRFIAQGIAQFASLAIDHARLLDQLERLNNLKSEFVAAMSHELRTPIHIILGYIDLLLEGEFGEINAEQAQYLRRMHRAGAQLLELVDATLDLGRLEKGGVELELAEVSLASLLEEVARDLPTTLMKERVQLQFHTQPTAPPLLLDGTKVKAVLYNLILNALKFTDERAVTVSTMWEEEEISISVSDTGIGIPPESLGVIFEPFRQLDGGSTRHHGGVGLGLHVARRLLDLMDGTIDVCSEVGRGSTFTVRIPVELAAS